MSRALMSRLVKQERAAGLTPWRHLAGTPMATWPEPIQSEWWAAAVRGADAALDALTDADLAEHINLLRAALATPEDRRHVAPV